MPCRLAMFSALALVCAWPLLVHSSELNLFRDAQVLYSYERDAAWSVLRFGQAPLWDPYYCGGLFALGTPQSRFASPSFVLSLLFGPARGEALAIFAMLVVGLEGTFRYVRARGGGQLGSFLAAPVFAISGVFIAAPFLGWTGFFGFELLPWTLLEIRRAVRGDVKSAALAGLFLAWIVGFGGTYAAPMAILLWGWELAIWLLEAERGRARAIGLFAFAASLALGVSAIRSAPLFETLYTSPRVLAGHPGMKAIDSLTALISPVRVRDGNLSRSAQMYTVGVGALAVAALAFCRRRRPPIEALLLAVLAFWAALGYQGGRWGLFALVKRLPIYESLRYPERYLVVLALAVSGLAARGFRVVQVWAGRHRARQLALAAVGTVLLVNSGQLLTNFQTVAQNRLLASAPLELGREFRQARGNRWLASYYAPMSRGSLSCWDAYPVPMSPRLAGNLPAEEYLADPTAGTVSRLRWSPNEIHLQVSLARATDVLVNQNYHPGWRGNAGQVHSVDGLLAVALPPGQHDLLLRFRPRAAIAGLCATTAATLGLVALLIWLRKRRRAPAVFLLAVAGGPLLLLAAVYSVLPSEHLARPVLVAPNGEPILAVAPRADAEVHGAIFANAAQLVAVRLPPGDDLARNEPFTVELDWRVIGALPRDTEILTRLVAGGRTIAHANHSLVSAAFALASVPGGTETPLVRDLVSTTLPNDVPSLEVEIWVGLRDGATGKKLLVTSFPSGISMANDEVLAGRIALRP